MGGKIKKINLPHNHNEVTKEMLAQQPVDEAIKESADIFAQLSDPNRLKILWLLCHTEECVINIASVMEMTSPAVSHHLRILKNSKLLKTEKCGKEVHYSLAKNDKAELVHRMIDEVFNITHNE